MTLLACSVLAALMAAGCQPPASQNPNDRRRENLQEERAPAEQSLRTATYKGEGPIEIVCTSGMVADIVRNVGGERVAVDQMMGEGVDPHLYKPTPGDVSRLARAEMIFFSGLHLEGKLADHFASMARDKPTVPVTLRLDPAKLIPADEGYFDPHVWFDVALWSECAQAVADVLAGFDPEFAETYRENAAAYRKRLVALDEYARTELAKIPPKQRVLVTAHDAFQYFGRAYDVEVKAIQGVSTTSEAGLRKINELVEYLTTNRIGAVFVETSVSDKNVQSLIEGCAERGHTVDLGGELFSDAMGREGTPEGTYEGMIRHNVETIRGALE
ncbi:MAG: zinc ABC transporter substrate-binding protein [Planctomycetes bacterium]|nr:zinc ABC transporter substrate-binding protein [Planctomycetota bacterium]